jgi:hypothetical protein
VMTVNDGVVVATIDPSAGVAPVLEITPGVLVTKEDTLLARIEPNPSSTHAFHQYVVPGARKPRGICTVFALVVNPPEVHKGLLHG